MQVGATTVRRPAPRVAVAVAVLLMAAGCGGPSTPEPPGASPAASGFTITSASIVPGGVIPARFTCDGEDVSPELSWAGAPGGAGGLVLVVDDPDAAGFVHWIVLDLGVSAEGSLPEGVSGTSGAPPEGTNDFGRAGWNGPCPPAGEHHYRFTVHALAKPLALSGAAAGREIREAIDGSTILASATLEARYSRP